MNQWHPVGGPNTGAPGRWLKRVVIVDDSRSMRDWLRHMIDHDTRLQVVGEAADAHEARKVIRETKPDVVTLDIDMPGMDGLTFLERLMRLHPLPVVMISSATPRGSDAAIQALSLGAVDCILKPTDGQDPVVRRDLRRRVFSAACSRVPLPVALPQQPVRAHALAANGPYPIVLIGASTGGVTALETVLRDLNPQGPPVVVVQHMPGAFLVSFARMLGQALPQQVGLLRTGDRLMPGQVALAPSGSAHHSTIQRSGNGWQALQPPAEPHALHCPSVNALFHSAVPYSRDVIAVLLTGLGRDGALGMQELHRAGARTLAQDADTCVVYGMPRAAVELGAVDQQLPLAQIGQAINRMARDARGAE